jgi:nitrite reductase/ring-hydroxylating ferredoxin subunit
MSDDKKGDRRDFLGVAALSACACTLGTALAGVARLPKPAVLPGPTQVFKLGDPAQFAIGSVTRFDEQRFFLFRGEQGFHAISSVCTHLGCIVARSEGGDFACPCHGSQFDTEGQVVGGPAPTGLAWLEVGLSPDGQVQVNGELQVPSGTTFSV